jgi:hypothetical protein
VVAELELSDSNDILLPTVFSIFEYENVDKNDLNKLW